MTGQEGQPRKRSAAKPDQETTGEQAAAEARAALDRLKAEEQARLKAEEALAEAQAALAIAQAEVEQERQARVKAEEALAEARAALATAQAEAERVPAEARIATGVAAENMELPLTTLGNGGAEQRFSFVVRLTADARGRPRRTEVEHVKSRKKESFPALDVQRLAAFINMCIGPPATPEPAIAPTPPPAQVAAPTPEPSRSVPGLDISSVEISREGSPGVTTLTLNRDEAFEIQARFQLQGSEAPELITRGAAFEIKVHANDMVGGRHALLTTYKADLAEGILDYTAHVQAPGLSPGLYRLLTIVTLGEPIKMVGYHEGPIIDVVGEQSPVSPAAPSPAGLLR